MNDRLHQSNPIARSGILRGEALWRALGFKNEKAFQRARVAGKIPIPLYPVPQQSRGVYALKADVEDFLAKQRKAADKPEEGSSMS
jgi:hypothetical protein